MATTTPDNIRTPSPSDPYNLVADLAILGSDVQTALNRRANSYIGTSSQRVAFTTAPEGVEWRDTNGSKLKYVRNGGAWVPELVDWTNISTALLSPYRGLLYATRTGRTVELRFSIPNETSGSFPSGGSGVTVGTIPEAWRPSGPTAVRGGCYLSGGNPGVVNIDQTTGVVTVYNQTGTTQTSMYGSITYVSDR